jgi:phage portal protein BeeE
MLEGLRAAVANWIAPQSKELSEEANRVLAGLSVGTTPPKRGTEELLRAYAGIPALRQIIGRIATAFAAIPWTVHRTKDRRGKSVRNFKLERTPIVSATGKELRAKALALGKQRGEIEELTDDPLLDFLDAGNDMMSGYDTRQIMQTHIELTGDGFGWIERSPLGMPVFLWPLVPHWVQDTPTPGEDFYTVRVGAQDVQFPSEDILHIRDPDAHSPYGRGSGIAQSLGDELDTDEYAATFSKSFFHNHAMPASIVMLDGAKQAEIDRIESIWEDRHRGHRRGHRTMFLGKKATVEAFDATFKDLGTVELRRFLRDVVRETWGVPPEIVGLLENSNRATIEAASYLFALWLLVPRAERWRMAIQTQVAPLFDKRKLVGYESPVPADKEFELEVATAAPWSRTRAEWRAPQGLDDHGDVDDVYMQPIGLIERPVDGPPPPPPQPPAPTRAMIEESIAAQRSKAVSPADVENVLEQLRPIQIKSRKPIADLWSEELRDWGDEVLEDLGVDVSFNMLNPKVVEHMDDFVGDRIDSIDDTTREALQVSLIEGVEAGESVRDLSKRVAGVFDLAKGFRTDQIARSEVARSANFGTHESHVQSGVVVEEEWVSTLDDRVRDEHLAMNGRRKGLNEDWVLPDGTVTPYPGGSGVASHDINERCTVVAVIDDEQRSADDLAVIWKAFDRKLLGWEREARTVFRDRFAEQEKIVLAALDGLAR